MSGEKSNSSESKRPTEISIMKWIHERVNALPYIPYNQNDIELLMAEAYAKGRDDQEAYMNEHLHKDCI